MFSSSDNDDQLVCWNCEESVHSAVLYCPYCNADLQKHASVRTTPPPSGPVLAKVSSTEASQPYPSMLRLAVTILVMSAGTSFLFLSMVIAAFSKDGSFVISWHERSSLSFLGLAIAFISLAIYSIQFKKNQEIE